MTPTQIIHRYWSGPESELGVWTGQAIRSLMPDAELRTWGPGDWPVNVDQVRPEDRVRHESNVARLRALLELGGLWLDHDVIPLVDLFAETGPEWTASIGGRREGCALRFLPKSRFVGAALAAIDAAPSSNGRSVDVSGGGLLNRVDVPALTEPRVIPFDASGRPVGIAQPIAVHLWETSRLRNREAGR